MSLPFKASFNQVTDSILIHITLYTLCIIDMVISKCFIGPNPNLRLFWGLIDASLACVNDLFGQLRPDPHGHSNAATVVRHFVRLSKFIHFIFLCSTSRHVEYTNCVGNRLLLSQPLQCSSRCTWLEEVSHSKTPAPPKANTKATLDASDHGG